MKRGGVFWEMGKVMERDGTPDRFDPAPLRRGCRGHRPRPRRGRRKVNAVRFQDGTEDGAA